jgi:Sec-independent protein translocase protein TatA
MSFWECMVILMVALLVIKPDRLPEMAYYTGRLLGRLKRFMIHIQEKYHLFW